METPSSTRRVTRSQAMTAASNSAKKIPLSSKKIEESGKTRQRNGKQSALIDITNDSPIVGLAMGNLETPSSEMSKKRISGQGKQHCNTPGSGEALLRGQVKTLLQKVEEEAVVSKISLGNRPFVHLKGIVNSSPMGLLAPTPANTPLMDFSANELPSVTASPVEDKFVISQIIDQMIEDEKLGNLESEKSYITRSLLLDFSEKSEGSESSSICSSVLTEAESKEKTLLTSDDDSASIWSIQVNASSTRGDEEEEEEEEEGLEEEEYDDDDDDDNVYDEEDGDLVDELCEAISNINVNGGPKMMANFEGKHTRFLYNNDEEIAGVEEVLHLKGLPTPTGKHLRFTEETEEEEN